jgi:cystathionine gamma-lyase
LQWENFESAIADLECANHALSFSGMAATTAAVQRLAANSHIVCMASLYGGAHRYLTQFAPACGVTVSFVKEIEAVLTNLIEDTTKLV